MTTSPDAVCNCTGEPPWPQMVRVTVGGINRYFLCPECKRIREEVCRIDGTIAMIRYHKSSSQALSQTVRQQAKAMLDLSEHEQMALFDEDE